jgi:hypothetical protein
MMSRLDTRRRWCKSAPARLRRTGQGGQLPFFRGHDVQQIRIDDPLWISLGARHAAVEP